MAHFCFYSCLTFLLNLVPVLKLNRSIEIFTALFFYLVYNTRA